MSKTYRFIPRTNKRNGQVNLTLGMKTLPKSLKELVKKQKVKAFEFKLKKVDLLK